MDSRAEDLRKVERAAKKATDRATEIEQAATVPAKGGTYVLKDPETGQVMRTGRTKDHARRELEHNRHPDTMQLKYEAELETDAYAAQRGHEQMLYDKHKPPLDKIRPISPTNPKREQYLKAARKLTRDKEQ